MGRECAPCRPEHLGEVVFIRDLSDNDLRLTGIFGGTASIHCGPRFAGRSGAFRHSFGQIIPPFPQLQSCPVITQFAIVHTSLWRDHERQYGSTNSDDPDALTDDEVTRLAKAELEAIGRILLVTRLMPMLVEQSCCPNWRFVRPACRVKQIDQLAGEQKGHNYFGPLEGPRQSK
jgi:hypothetical protein